LGLSPLAIHTGMGRRDKARFPAGRGRQSVVSHEQCSSGNGSLRLTEKCCIVRPSCFVAFQPLGSLRSSPPKRLSPLELDKEGIDVDLEYLDDVSVFGCDILANKYLLPFGQFHFLLFHGHHFQSRLLCNGHHHLHCHSS